MTSDEAAMVLREAIKSGDGYLARSLAGVLESKGYADLYEFVEQQPELAIELAEVEVSAQEQLASFARQLEGGALGDRTNDEPSA